MISVNNIILEQNKYYITEYYNGKNWKCVYPIVYAYNV